MHSIKMIAKFIIIFFSNLSGIKDDVGSKSIDQMNPSTKEEFAELSQLLVGKLSNYEVMVKLMSFFNSSLLLFFSLSNQKLKTASS